MKASTASLLLLAVVYLAYISLGLPDTVLGVSWPFMRLDFFKPLEAAGILSVTLTICSALSSFLSGPVLSRFGTGRVTFVSCLMTATGLVGYSLAPSFLWLLPCVPLLGFGAGAIDSGLNYYVAAHYSSRHMSWLHCCWGLGATAGPAIVTACIAGTGSWRGGYRTLGLIQLSLSVVLFLALGLWDRVRPAPDMHIEESASLARDASVGLSSPEETAAAPVTGAVTGTAVGSSCAAAALKSRLFRALAAQITMYPVYVAVEFLVGLWGFSLLVQCRAVAPTTAGFWISLYYGALTAGRFVNGLFVNRLGNRTMIRLGLSVALAGVGFLAMQSFVPSAPALTALAGLLLMGFGFGPVYPCMTHETARRFRPETAQRVMGAQIGAACLGGSLVPALIGLLAARATLEIVPFSAGVLIVSLLALNAGLDRLTANGPL